MCDSDDLLEACKNGYYDKVVNLLKRNYTVHVRDSKQATPLYYSSCHGYYNICNILIENGSDVNARVQWGSTALHAAADRGHIDCVKLLIVSGADLSVQNQRGDTALHLCAYRGHLEIVKVFIQNNCNSFIKNSNEKTAYDEAEGNNQHNTATLLRKYMLGSNTGIDLGFNQDNGTQQQIPQNSHGQVPSCSSTVSRTTNGSENFVRYSNDLTKFTRQSAPIIRQGSLEEKQLKQVRPTSQPLYRQPDSGLSKPGNSHSNVHNGFCYDQKYSRVVQNGGHNMIDNSRLLLHLQGREAMETFAENLQIQYLKKSDECEEKDKVIQQLQDSLKSQQEKLKTISLAFVRLQDEKATLKHGNANTAKQNCDIESGDHSVTHRGILSALSSLKHHELSLNSDESFQTLKEVLKSIHLSRAAPTSLDEPNKEWRVGKDFILLGDKPLNCMTDGERDGSCSLVFLIKHKKDEYVLKMMTNLINLQAVQHGEGHSLDQFLVQNFGSEHIIPVTLPYHPNVITIRHQYMGATDRFKKFMNLLIPAKIDVPIEMANRTSFLVMDKYQQTLKTFMVQQRTVYPKPSFGLNSRFLLQLLYQILSSLFHLQKHGVVHRDIKADNIFLDCCLRPILTDFGFAKSISSRNSGPLFVTSDQQVCAGNNHAWAPELVRYSRQGLTQRGSGGAATLQQIYGKADAYAVGRMFYSLLRPINDGDHFPQSSVNVPHYEDSDIPELPACYAEGLRWILHNLVLDNPSQRISERKAMLCAGMMLFPPNDLRSEIDTLTYCQARIMTLLALNNQSNCLLHGRVLSAEQSVKINSLVLESDFLYSTTPTEFWDIYQFLQDRGLL